MRFKLNFPNQTIPNLLLNHSRQTLVTKQEGAEGGVEGKVDMRLGLAGYVCCRRDVISGAVTLSHY